MSVYLLGWLDLNIFVPSNARSIFVSDYLKCNAFNLFLLKVTQGKESRFIIRYMHQKMFCFKELIRYEERILVV